MNQGPDITGGLQGSGNRPQGVPGSDDVDLVAIGDLWGRYAAERRIGGQGHRCHGRYGGPGTDEQRNQHHRGDRAALRAQLQAYGAGHAAAQWKAFRVYGDRRALGRLLLGLHWTQLRRLLRRALGRSRFPASLILAESLGHLRGPLAW